VSDLVVDEATAADAAALVDVIHRSFAARPALDPPSTALDETEQSVRATIASSGGLVCRVDRQPAGAILFGMGPRELYLRRVCAVPEFQSRGVASAMIGVAEEIAAARGFDDISLEVRLELPSTVEFWYRRGYRELYRDGARLRYGKALSARLTVPDADAMKAVGRELGGLVRAGDLLVLSGELGAGKTTMVQGFGCGLRVRGPITSPTFVLSRIHPSLDDGPPLVHVDAYRLGEAAEVDDLDLDAYLDSAVIAVEWGEGVAEGLAEERLLVRISRPYDDGLHESGLSNDRSSPVDDDIGELRRVVITPVGASWLGRRLRSRLLSQLLSGEGSSSAPRPTDASAHTEASAQ
jgi:tRNA threonylcarbamoyladenosine biosynthesis protein TsaE